MTKRGPWCWQFSYEFADVVSTVLNEDFDDHFEPFLLMLLPDIFSAFVPDSSSNYADANADHIAGLILDGIEDVIFETTVASVRDALFSNLIANIPILNEVTDLLSFLGEHSGLETDVDGAIQTELRHWIDSTIKPALRTVLRDTIQAAIDAVGALDRAASEIIAKWLFKITADIFFAENLPSLQVGGMFETALPASFFADLLLFDPGSLDQLIDIDVDIPNIVTSAFSLNILGIPKSIGEIDWGRFHLTAADLPLLDWDMVLRAFNVPIAINAAYAIHQAADYLDKDDNWIAQQLSQVSDLNPFKGDFYPFGYFLLMAANGSFSRYAFNGDILAEAFENGFFAALNYRLHGQTAALHILREQAAVAPDEYPNGRSETIWDEDFLWLRDRKPGDEQTDKIFSGLDFLSAIAIAASADAPGNRQVLRDAIEKVLEESSKVDVPEGEGVFNLPFRGPISGSMPAFVPPPEDIGTATHLNVSVVFASPGTPGRVRVRIANTGAPSDIIEFRQNRAGKVVVVPTSPSGIAIESAEAGVAGVLVVALPKL